MKRYALALILAAGSLQGLSAQDTPANIRNTMLDTSVPESPAFTVLGLTPSTITRPASPRMLASSLLNGIDSNGNIQTGIAIDTAPYMVLYGNQVTLEAFQRSKVVRVIARTQASVATTKGASAGDKSAKLAAGFNVAIFDKGDARTDPQYLRQLAALVPPIVNGLPPLSPNATADEVAARNALIVARVEQAAKSVREQFRKQAWNRSSWIVAAAPAWISRDGTTSNLKSNGTAVWTSLAYGFENVPGLKDNAQLIVHGRFHSRESVPDPRNAGAFYEQRSGVFGVAMRFGTANTIGAFELAAVVARPVDRPADDYLRIALTGEERLTDDVWLHFSAGGESRRVDGGGKLFVLGAFKWAAGPK